MRFGQFSLMVPEGIERDSGHVHLPHGQQYRLQLGNHCGRRAQAEVAIDGKIIGVFVLRVGQVAHIERSPDDHGRFTFYADATAEAQAAGLATVPTENRGLVRVAFTPELRLPTPTSVGVLRAQGMRDGRKSGGPGGQSQGGGFGRTSFHSERPTGGGVRGQSMGSNEPDMSEAASFVGESHEEKTSGGITGLSGMSTQRFQEVSRFPLDESSRTVLTLRLVLLDEGPRPLVGTTAAPHGNPVPPPVG